MLTKLVKRVLPGKKTSWNQSNPNHGKGVVGWSMKEISTYVSRIYKIKWTHTWYLVSLSLTLVFLDLIQRGSTARLIPTEYLASVSLSPNPISNDKESLRFGDVMKGEKRSSSSCSVAFATVFISTRGQEHPLKTLRNSRSVAEILS